MLLKQNPPSPPTGAKSESPKNSQSRHLRVANPSMSERALDSLAADAAWQQAEEKYRRIFENAVEGIFQTTPDGTYIIANPALARIYGYNSPEELKAKLKDIGAQLYVNPQRRIEFLRQLEANNTVTNFESQVYRRDGSIIWISENARAVRDANGTLLYCEGFVSDITPRKLAEEKLYQSEAKYKEQARQLEAALEQLQRAQFQLIQSEKLSSLGQMVAGIAHEINNPVNFVCGNFNYSRQYAGELLELLHLYQKYYANPVPEIKAFLANIDLEFLQEDFPKTLASMQMGADRIRQIVQSLRNFARVDDGKMKAVDLHEGIDSTLLILQNRLKSNGDRPAIAVLKQYGDLPLVPCYPGPLNQVFMNILSNAIDALEEYDRKRAIADIKEHPSRISIRTDVYDNNWVEICISDNGPGMPETIREKIFEPFFTTKPSNKGTGLGLSISHQIVAEKHAGTLTCISAPEQGTEFIIGFPLLPEES